MQPSAVPIFWVLGNHDILSKLVYSWDHFFLLETGQRYRLLWITETMSESLIMVHLTCTFCLSHKPDAQRLPPSGTSACLSVYSSGTQDVKSQSQGHVFRLMSGNGAHSRDQHCKRERVRQKEAGPGLTPLCNTVNPQACLVPASITQFCKHTPTSLTALG